MTELINDTEGTGNHFKKQPIIETMKEKSPLLKKFTDAINSCDEMSNFDRELCAKLCEKITIEFAKEFAEWIEREGWLMMDKFHPSHPNK